VDPRDHGSICAVERSEADPAASSQDLVQPDDEARGERRRRRNERAENPYQPGRDVSRRNPVNYTRTIVAAGLIAASTSAFAAEITGAGATFPYPIYSKWADAYKKQTGNELNYQSVGSGAVSNKFNPRRNIRCVRYAAHARSARKGQPDQWPMVMVRSFRCEHRRHQAE